MSLLTLVTTCKGRLEYLRQTLPWMATRPEIQCVLVDYNCPQHAAEWAEQNHPQVRTVRVHDAADFNLCKARNLGAQICTTPFIGFVDSDVLLTPDFHHFALPLLQQKRYVRSDSPAHELAGFVMCALQDFTMAGGYDETFEGWGAEDTDFYLRLELTGCRKTTLDSHLTRALTHTDGLRTQFHRLRDRFLSLRINSLYLQAKTDLARHLGLIQLPQVQRQKLYAEITRTITAEPDQAVQLAVTLPAATDAATPPGWTLTRKLVYQYDPQSAQA